MKQVSLAKFPNRFCATNAKAIAIYFLLTVIQAPAALAGGFLGALFEGDVGGMVKMTGNEVKRRTDACLGKGVNGCVDDIKTGVRDGAQTGAAALSCYEGNVMACAEAGTQLYSHNPRIFGSSRPRPANPSVGAFPSNPMPGQVYQQLMPSVDSPTPYGQAEYGQPYSAAYPDQVSPGNSQRRFRQPGYGQTYPTYYIQPLPAGYGINALQGPYSSSYQQQVQPGYALSPYYAPSPYVMR